MRDILKAITDTAPFGLVVLDRTGVVQDVNPWLLAQTGKEVDDLLQHPFATLFPDAEDALRRYLVQDYGGERTLSGEGELAELAELRPELKPVRIQIAARQAQLNCSISIPFVDKEGTFLHGLLFYDAADAGVFHSSFAAALQRLREIQAEQIQLLKDFERINNRLIQSEKLAGIGQLAAGVAHEINNPMGYVFSNLKTLKTYVQDLLRITDAIDHIATLDELRQLKCTLEYDYLRDDVDSLLDESEEGVNRVKKIISALKDFSHIQEEGFRLGDLHRGIETTLNVVHNELRNKAEVRLEFGSLPEIECNASQINQVVMNLLVNAAHALERQGIITVRTGHEAPWVWFEVQDTGPGIPPDSLKRIFEPFFTTKPVGQGTGLGLSLSHSIIRSHHGEIEVFSQPGEGTRFRVWLPVSQPIGEKPHG